MRVGLAAAACLALTLGACQGTRTPSPSPSLSVTDLSSVKLATPAPVPTGTPMPSRSPKPHPATPTFHPSPTPIDLSPTDTPVASATAGATPQPTHVAFATPAADCVNGWTSPADGSTESTAALDTMQTQMDVAGPWAVGEMRYFTGPDVPWIIDPHYDVVQYWYVRASRSADPTFAGRWLLEQRTDTIKGISAVAPASTTGYQSPDWTGFVGDGPPQIYAGLPGEWSGVPYDFVTGEGDSGQPGLPNEVVGCLSGT